jgi:hypothetical protein
MNVKEIATMFVFESESTPGKDYQTLHMEEINES